MPIRKQKATHCRHERNVSPANRKSGCIYTCLSIYNARLTVGVLEIL